MSHEIPRRVHPGAPSAGCWDAWGQALSLLCLAHCLLLPLILGALPVVMARSLEHTPFHSGVVVLAALIGGVSFVSGFRQHQDWRVPALGAVGVAVLVLAQFLSEGHLETGVTVVGGTLLWVTHGLNRRRCQACCAVELEHSR